IPLRRRMGPVFGMAEWNAALSFRASGDSQRRVESGRGGTDNRATAPRRTARYPVRDSRREQRGETPPPPASRGTPPNPHRAGLVTGSLMMLYLAPAMASAVRQDSARDSQAPHGVASTPCLKH